MTAADLYSSSLLLSVYRHTPLYILKTELCAVEAIITLNYTLLHHAYKGKQKQQRNLLWKGKLRPICVHDMSPHVYNHKIVLDASQNDIKYSSTNNKLAASHFSLFFHHRSILHCVSQEAENNALGFTYSHKIWPFHQPKASVG